MPSFNSKHQNDRGVRWWGIAATAMVELLVLFVFAFAVVRYVEWSSDANQAEFHERPILAVRQPSGFVLRSDPSQTPYCSNCTADLERPARSA